MANTNGSVVQKKFFREQIQRNMFVFVFWIMFLIGKAVFEVYILVEIVRKIVNSILTGNFILKNAIPEYGGLLLVYVAVFFVGCIFRFYIVSNGNINMENSLLGQILRLKSWNTRYDAGDVMAKIKNDIPKCITSEVTLIELFVDMAVCIVLGSIYALSMNAVVYFVCAGIVILAYVITYKSYKKMPEIEKRSGTLYNRNYTNVWEIVANSEIVPFLSRKKVLKNFNETAELNVQNAVQKGISYANVNICKKIINVGLVYFVCVIGAVISFGSDDIPGEVANISALVVLIPKIANALLKTYDWSVSKKEYTGICKRINELFTYAEYVEEGKKEIVSKIREIRVKDLGYAYDSHEVFENIGCAMTEGNMYYISGDSGTGKSTFIKLLMGLLPLQTGDIVYNGTKLIDINRKSLWKRVSYVAQDPIVMKGTVRDNILMNEPYDGKRMEEVLGIVLFDSLHINPDTAVDSDTVSSGEKQKICLARELYQNKEVLILDEATSQMDPMSQKNVYVRLLEYCRKNKIIVLVVNHNKAVVPSESVEIVIQERAE